MRSRQAKALTSISRLDCGQVEVGEQRADQAEIEAGRDEDVGCGGVRFDWTTAGRKRGGFERADHRGADGDDAAVFCDSAIDGGGGRPG